MDRNQRWAVNASVKQAIAVLNEALTADRAAVEAVMLYRVTCNAELAQHATVQVGDESEGDGTLFSLGPMGLINGIFGVDEAGWGHIAAVLDPVSHRILRFEVTRDDPA